MQHENAIQKRTRGYTWQKMRELYLQQFPLCVDCDRQGRIRLADQVDHIVPLAKGGTDAFNNLQGLCVECHQIKTALDMGYHARPEIGLDGWPIEPQPAGQPFRRKARSNKK